MNGKQPRLEDLLEALDNSLRGFLEEARRFPSELVREKPTTKAFSATEIVYHMIDVERLWISRITSLLDRTSTYFQQMDPDREAIENHYNEKAYSTGVDELENARRSTLRFVRSMKPRELELTGTHSKYGPMNTYRILSIMSEHDHTHLAQMKRTLASVRSIQSSANTTA